jgi:glycosyltransferase involved in cell wall biosynthesis
MTPTKFLYLSSILPTRSETFVYHELFALRGRGMRVRAATVHPPARDLGEARLESLAAEAIPIYGAGTARLLRDAAAELLRRPGRTVRVLGLALRDAACAADVRGRRRLKVLWQALAGLALAHRVRPLGVRHVHAHMAHVPTTIAMYSARQLGVRFSFTGHANDLFPQRALLAEKLRRAAFVACISHWHRKLYREIAPDLPDERLPIVRCGVAVPPEAVTPGTRPQLRTLGVGRLVPKKGFDVLLRAVAQLVAAGCELSCRIIGGGPEETTLRRLAAELRIETRVAFDGSQPHAAVQGAIRSADVFVLPCRVDDSGDRDGIPVVLMEALAAGVPVLTGDLPAIRELVRHEDTGLLTPPGDVATVAAGLRRLHDDRSLLQSLGTRGREWVREEFEREVNVSRLIAAFDHHTAAAPIRAAQVAEPPGGVSGFRSPSPSTERVSTR